MKVLHAIMFLLLLQSCISSRYEKKTPCFDDISKGVVLVPEIAGVSPRQSEKLFKIIQNELSRKTSVLYYPHEEWNLAVKGLVRTDPAFMEKLNTNNIPFVMYIDIIDEKKGEIFTYLTPLEVRSRWDVTWIGYRPQRRETAETSVLISLSVIDTKTQQRVCHGITKTTISPVTFRDDDGGENQVNGGSTALALNKAIKKGIRKMFY